MDKLVFNAESMRDKTLPYTHEAMNNMKKVVDILENQNSDIADRAGLPLEECLKTANDSYEILDNLVDMIFLSLDLFYQMEEKNYEVIEEVFRSNGDFSSFLMSNNTSKYGINQGALGIAYYISDEKTIASIAKQYNMSMETAADFCQLLDSIGACSYAAAANMIIDAYIDDPIQFEKDFGFSLLKVNANGNVVVNSELLLADMFLFYNCEEHGGKLFYKNYKGNYVINYKHVSNDEGKYDKQFALYCVYLEEDADRILAYVKDKKLNIEMERISYSNKKTGLSQLISDIYSIDFISKHSKEEIQKDLNYKLKEGNLHLILSINICNMTDVETGEKSLCNGAHATYVTEITDEGFIVSSWGRKYLITYSDLDEAKEYEIDAYKSKCTESDNFSAEELLRDSGEETTSYSGTIGTVYRSSDGTSS